MTVDIIGVPFDLSGMRYGTRLGPGAVRLAGLDDALMAQGLQVNDKGDLPMLAEHTEEGGIRNFCAAYETLVALRESTTDSLERGALPLMLGGEHTLSIGSVSAALEHYQGDVALLWIDAHADLNNPGTSWTGNLHGMPIGALWGLGSETEGLMDHQWRQLLDLVGPYKLKEQKTAWFGLRDVDPGESRHMGNPSFSLPVTMQDIDRHGILTCMQRVDEFLRESNAHHLWVSFDVDSLDPYLAPGTGTAVRGGLSYREGHFLAEIICEMLNAEGCPYKLVGVDLVETNPIYDTNNATAIVAVEWFASLFGKTILGRR